MATGKRQRGKAEKQGASKKPKPGQFKKWCPMPGCNKVILNVGRHLTEGKSHGLKKGSAEYNEMMKSAKKYTGLGDIEAYLEPPASESHSDSDSEVETTKKPSRKRRKVVSSVAIALKWLFVTIRNFGGIPPPEDKVRQELCTPDIGVIINKKQHLEKYANRQQISRAAGGVEIQSKSCVTVN